MPLNAAFEDAIRVTPEGANKYSANLRSEWCIGTGKAHPPSKTRIIDPKQSQNAVLKVH